MDNVVNLFEYKANKEKLKDQKFWEDLKKSIAKKEEEANIQYTERQLHNIKVLKAYKLGKYAHG
jgi:hypothetical protein